MKLPAIVGRTRQFVSSNPESNEFYSCGRDSILMDDVIAAFGHTITTESNELIESPLLSGVLLENVCFTYHNRGSLNSALRKICQNTGFP